MTVSLTIHTESAPLALGSGAAGEAPALGITWFVSAKYVAGSITQPAHWDALKAMLSPWEWQDLDFVFDNVVQGPAKLLPPASPTDPDIAALETLLVNMLDKYIKDPAMLNLALDDESEADPHWPLALMQLSRSDPRISHQLQLARLFKADFPDSSKVSGARLSEFKLSGVTVPCPAPGNTTQVTINGLVIDITQQLENVWSVDEIRQTNRLLDGFARLVASKDETRRDWFSGLAAFLGRAISPVLRLADLMEQDKVGDPPTLARQGLRVLVEAIVLPNTAASATPLSLLFGERSTGTFQQWEIDVRNAAAAIAGRLYDVFLKGGQSPEVLRNTVQAEAFAAILADALIDLAPTNLRGGASSVLLDPRNMAALIDTLAVSAIARRDLAAILAQEAGHHPQLDAEPLLTAFGTKFPGVLAGLLGIDPVANQKPLEAVAEAQARLLEAELEELDGLDAAQDSGIAFRVDTVFKSAAVPESDIHETLDGALIAIRRSDAGLSKAVLKPDDVTDWKPFELVSRGKVEAAFAPLGPAPVPLRADLGVLTTPVPVGLIEDYSSGGTKAQQAIEKFFGHVMTPLSGRPVPNMETRDPTAFWFDYGLYPLDLDLAFGRVFHVEVGYQSLAGAMPAGWCDPDQPFAFRPDVLEGSNGHTNKKVALLRTKPPGPPEFADDPDPKAPFTGLTGPRDHEVRPLWRERVAAWSDAANRRRVETSKTVYLDAERARSKRQSFFILPPNLTAKDKRYDTDSERVWDYWIRRDRDVGVASPVRNGTAPDPAVVGIAGGATSSKGGVLVKLMEVEKAGLVDIDSAAVLFDAGRAIEIVLECDAAAQPAIAAGPRTVISLPPARLFAVEFQTLVDAEFFTGGADPRFDQRLKQHPYTSGGVVTHYAFGTQGLVIECLPAGEPASDHLPSEAALWDALALSDAQGRTWCEFKSPDADPSFAYVGSVETVRQSWSWDAGPVDDSLLDALTWGNAETARPRQASWLAAENAYFVQRGIVGRTETTTTGLSSDTTRLFDIAARPNRGADYLRVRATAISRYAPLREGDSILEPGLKRVARAGSEPSDIWKAIALKARRRDVLATPRLATLAPMFGVIEAGNASAGDWCAHLDHPLYDPNNGGGLAERLVAEIVVEHLGHCLQPDGEGESAALSVGYDPTLGGQDLSYETPANTPQRYVFKSQGGSYPPIIDDAWNPESREGAILQVKAVLGQTLEPFSAAPIVPFSVGFFGSAIGKHRLRPGTMIKVRLRLEAVKDRFEGDFAAFHSPWSAVRWITISANTDYQEFFEPPVYDQTAGALRLKFRGDPGDPRIARLVALIDDSAPGAGAPYLVQGLVAAIGNIVGDLRGDDVIRPVDAPGNPPRTLLKGGRNGNDLLFPCQKPPSGDYFLRALEMRTVSLPAPSPPGLDTLLPETAEDAGGQVVAIGPLWQFQLT